MGRVERSTLLAFWCNNEVLAVVDVAADVLLMVVLLQRFSCCCFFTCESFVVSFCPRKLEKKTTSVDAVCSGDASDVDLIYCRLLCG